MKLRSTSPIFISFLAVTLFGFLELCAPLSRSKFLLNLSASVPVGFYALTPLDRAYRGELVVFPVPKDTAEFLGERHWLKSGVPLLKRISALAGDRVCITQKHISINGAICGNVFTEDSEGKPLPRLSGCFVVSDNSFLALNTEAPSSFDSRYFKEVSLKEVIGSAVPILTWH